MAVGKNKTSMKSKKGGKKKIINSMAKKEWYDILVPKIFTNFDVGKTIVNRSQGTRNAADDLKGRVVEVNLADLQGDSSNFRKFEFVIENVLNKTCYTSFHGTSLTTDKIWSMVRRNQSTIECIVDVKTADDYVLRVFMIGFTGEERYNSVGFHAKTTQIKRVRRKMKDRITRHIGESTIEDVMKKLLSDEISKEAEKDSSRITKVHGFTIRKVKVIKSPKTDIGKLMELHGVTSTKTVEGTKASKKVVAPSKSSQKPVASKPSAKVISRASYEPPILTKV